MKARRPQRGATLVEVLVTLVIIGFGLLGMAGLQMRLQVSEIESYQRSQALLLLNDMSSRISTNRKAAAAYATGVAYGAGMSCPAATGNTAERDLREWCMALQGASETSDAGATRHGAMVGGRGCVQRVGQDFLVTVAWQGMTPVSAPPAGVNCGANQYEGARSCINDACRRVVTTLLRIATL